MFTKRQHEILSIVLNQANGIKGTSLAELLGVTDRTIRNDIAAVNRILKTYNCMISSSQQNGYYITNDQRQNILTLVNRKNVEADNIDRLYELLGIILFEKGNININDLAETLFISEQTVLLDLSKIQKKLLIDYSLDLFDIKKDEILLKASETDIRILLAKLSKKEVMQSRSTRQEYLQHMMNGYYVEEDYDELLKDIKEYYQQNEITLSSDSLYMFGWMLYFIITRNDLGYFMDEKIESQTQSDSMLGVCEYLILKGYILNDYDQQFLSKFISTLGVIRNDNKIFIISDNTKKIVLEFRDDIKNKYGFDIMENQELFENMMLHIEIMIRRLKEKLPLINPILDDVKLKYPYSYEIAMLSVQIIYKYEHEYLNDHEISYLAIYIQSYIEEAKIKLRTLIVSGSGAGLIKLIKQWIINNFSNVLEVKDYIPSYEVASYEYMNDCDVIISSVPLGNMSKPVIYINGIPDQKDKENIYAFIKKINIERNLIKTVEVTFSSNLFKHYAQSTSFEQVIYDLSYLLKKEGVISDEAEFAKNVIEREPLYPTKLSEGFMIPHPLKEMANRNAVAVGILENGLIDDKGMKCIFLLALNSNTNQGLDVFFQIISLLSSDYQNILFLSKSNETNLISNLIEIAERNP